MCQVSLMLSVPSNHRRISTLQPRLKHLREKFRRAALYKIYLDCTVYHALYSFYLYFGNVALMEALPRGLFIMTPGSVYCARDSIQISCVCVIQAQVHVPYRTQRCCGSMGLLTCMRNTSCAKQKSRRE